jgi:hypothetical protein
MFMVKLCGNCHFFVNGKKLVVVLVFYKRQVETFTSCIMVYM